MNATLKSFKPDFKSTLNSLSLNERRHTGSTHYSNVGIGKLDIGVKPMLDEPQETKEINGKKVYNLKG